MPSGPPRKKLCRRAPARRSASTRLSARRNARQRDAKPVRSPIAVGAAARRRSSGRPTTGTDSRRRARRGPRAPGSAAAAAARAPAASAAPSPPAGVPVAAGQPDAQLVPEAEGAVVPAVEVTWRIGSSAHSGNCAPIRRRASPCRWRCGRIGDRSSVANPQKPAVGYRSPSRGRARWRRVKRWRHGHRHRRRGRRGPRSAPRPPISPRAPHADPVAPDSDFTYRPLAVAEPFGFGHAHRVPSIASPPTPEPAGPRPGRASTTPAGEDAPAQRGDARVRCPAPRPGARPAPGIEGRHDLASQGDSEVYGGLLREIDEGYTKAACDRRTARGRLAAARLRARAHDRRPGARHGSRRRGGDARHSRAEPLTLFGSARPPQWRRSSGGPASDSLPASWRGRGRRPRPERRGEWLEPSGGFAVPRLLGPAIPGAACDEGGASSSPSRTGACAARGTRLGGR